MRRRVLLLAILVVAPLALSLRAQTGANIPRVGILIFGTAASTGGVAQAIIEGMRERGYVEGKNVRFEMRFGDGSREQVSGTHVT